MQELQNLVKIQQSMNVDPEIRLPILELTTSGYYPCMKKDMEIIRQEIVSRACKTLPENYIFIRGKNLYSLNEKRLIEKIPQGIYSELFNSHKVRWEITEQQEIIGKQGFKAFKTVKKLHDDCIDIGILRQNIENLSVTNQIINNNLIPELVWNNEVGEENSYTPTMPNVDRISMEMATSELTRWQEWMLKNEPEQWDFFLMALDLFSFSNAKRDAERKIMVGIGPNGGGKGSMIKMLEGIPNCRRPDDFGFAALDKEYRSCEAFKPGSSLSVCHEYQLTQKLDIGSIGLIKSATRNETLGVRTVGSAAKEIKFYGGLVLFVNSMAEKKMAVNSAQRYFSEWLAYDRFNIVFIDWFLKYPRAKHLREIFNYTGTDYCNAFGIKLWEMANSNRDKPIPFYPIPESFKAEGAGEFATRYEQLLENLLEAWGEFHSKIESMVFEGQYPEIAEQQKVAIVIFSPLFKEKSLLAKEFQFIDKTEKGPLIKSVFNSSTMNQSIEKVGGNRKWQVPPSLSEFINKNSFAGTNRNCRERVVHFDGLAYFEKN